MRHATITGTGSYVPRRTLTNADLSAMLGEDVDEFVSGVLGIRERHVCAADESAADLAEAAARSALESAGLAAADLDLLIVSTDTPEYVTPATSSVLHGRLGLSGQTGTFDLNAACAGYVTALDTAWKFIRADERYRHVLVVAVYAMSKYVDYSDKKVATIFADGAGATVVSASDVPGVLGSELYADGSLAGGMGVFAGGTAEPIDEAVLASGYRNRLRFVEKYPAEVNLEGWPRIARSVLARAGRSVNEVDLWLWTQVNLSHVRGAMERLGVPLDRAHTIMGKWGYTGSACLPMALDDAVAAGRLRDGDLVVLTGSGAGLNMGCVVLEWRPSTVPAHQTAAAAAEAAGKAAVIAAEPAAQPAAGTAVEAAAEAATPRAAPLAVGVAGDAAAEPRVETAGLPAERRRHA